MLGWKRGLDCLNALVNAVTMHVFPLACAHMHECLMHITAATQTSEAVTAMTLAEVRLSADGTPPAAARG